MNNIRIAERLIKLAEMLLEKEALTEAMQNKLINEVWRVRDIVVNEGVTVEDAMDLVFGKGFKNVYSDWYEKIKRYVLETLKLESKKRSSMEKVAVIKNCKKEDKRSSDDVWCVYSEKGRLLGRYSTKEDAEKRLKQVEYFKHKN
jgi:hypothetical protein